MIFSQGCLLSAWFFIHSYHHCFSHVKMSGLLLLSLLQACYPPPKEPATPAIDERCVCRHHTGVLHTATEANLFPTGSRFAAMALIRVIIVPKLLWPAPTTNHRRRKVPREVGPRSSQSFGRAKRSQSSHQSLRTAQ